MPTLVQRDAQKFTYPTPPTTNVLYAAPNGSTTASGTDINAPVTLTRALNLANSAANAQTIVLRGGVYNQAVNNEINKAGTTLTAYGSEFPVISGFKNFTSFSLVSGLYETTYNNVLPVSITDSRAVTSTNAVVKNLQMVLMGDKLLKQVGAKSSVVEGTYYIDFGANKLYLKDNPASFGGVSAVGAEFGLRLNAANTTVRGIGLMGYIKGFRINGTTNVVVDRVTARYFSQAIFNTAPNAQSTVSRTEMGYAGMVCYDGGGVQTIIEDCDVHDGNVSRFEPGWSSGGIKLTSNLITTNMSCVVRRNKVYECTNAGIWIDINVRDQVIYDNEVYNCVIGIEDEISHRNAYVNNYVHDCGTAFLVSCTEGAELWHNTIENCGTPFTVKDWGRDRDNTEAQNPKDGSWKTQATVINNNLVVAKSRSSQFFLNTETYSTELSTNYISSLKNNVYVRSGSIPTNYSKWSGGASSQDIVYASLEDFKLDFSGYESGSVELTALPSVIPNGVAMPARVANVFGAAAGSVRKAGSSLSVSTVVPPVSTTAELEARIDILQADLTAVTDERDQLKTTNAALTSRVNSLTAQVSSLIQERDEARAEVDRLLNDPANAELEVAKDKLARVKAVLLPSEVKQALDIIG